MIIVVISVELMIYRNAWREGKVPSETFKLKLNLESKLFSLECMLSTAAESPWLCWLSSWIKDTTCLSCLKMQHGRHFHALYHTDTPAV